MYEYYSTLDSKIVDNVVSRSISQPVDKKTDQDMKMLKMIIIGSAIASAIAAFLVWQNNGALLQICSEMGISCSFA